MSDQQDRLERLQQAGWVLTEPPVGIVSLMWEIKREGPFDWQLWRHHPAGISEAVGKPHWFAWTASRQMDREMTNTYVAPLRGPA